MRAQGVQPVSPLNPGDYNNCDLLVLPTHTPWNLIWGLNTHLNLLTRKVSQLETAWDEKTRSLLTPATNIPGKGVDE